MHFRVIALRGVQGGSWVALWVLEGLEPQETATLTEASLSATRSRIFYAQKEGAARDGRARPRVA
jgi:DNA-directed RNA polymerase specialized sigma24 family protein